MSSFPLCETALQKSVAKCRGSWVVGKGRGSWVWVWVNVVGKNKKNKERLAMKCDMQIS